jgi:transcriptional regulator with GAF, ATPase, and Fis domain
MLNNWRNIRIILTAVFMAFLVVSFYMLFTISHLPSGGTPFKTRLFLSLFILSVIGILLFLSSFYLKNTGPIPENLVDEKSDDNGTSSPEQTKLSEKQAPTKQGRLVKKLKNLLAKVEASSLEKLGDSCLSSLAHDLQIVQGLFYYREPGTDLFQTCGKYAWYSVEQPPVIQLGESLSGQAAKDGKLVHIPNVPDNYIQVLSGLGTSSPKHLYVIPLMRDETAWGIIELASFKELDHFSIQFIQAFAEHIAGLLEEISLKK